MPIALAPLNEEITIIKVLTDEKNKKHLESLGVLVNAKVKVISSMNGGVILVVKSIIILKKINSIFIIYFFCSRRINKF